MPKAQRPVSAGDPPESPSSDAAEAERRRRIGIRVLLVIGLILSVLMVVFGTTTARSYDEFATYQKATLDNPAAPPRWETEALSVDGCVDEVLAWVEACPGVSSWCEGALPDVMNKCLATQDRSAFCDEVGDAVLSTRFGYDECAERYDAIEGRYARRFAKKHCAAIYRVIAGHCAPIKQQDQR